MVYQKDKVSDVIEVLSVMKKEKETAHRYQNTMTLRKLATKIAAESELENNRYKNSKSAHNTTHDALARRLKPDIQNINAFDKLADGWLNNKCMKLKEILLGHTISGVQSSKVEKFFDD